MIQRWSAAGEAEFVARYGAEWGDDLAKRTYTARLIGMEADLVLHGGGNTSVKTTTANILGEQVPVIHVKASGCDLATIAPEDQPGIDLRHLQRLIDVPRMSDSEMVNELRTHMLRHDSATPSLEALVHAFLPKRFVDHTHADAILALTNQRDGARLVREALGDGVIVIEYVRPGFDLARAVADAFRARPDAPGMVLMHHGLITWGESARESYEATITLVTKAEEYARARTGRHGATAIAHSKTSIEGASERFAAAAPILRGLLAARTGCPDRPYRRVILRPLITPEVLDFVDSDRGRDLALTAPLTTDHLIRTKPRPLWIDPPPWNDGAALRDSLARAVAGYVAEYDAYLARHAPRMEKGLSPFDPLPRVVLVPGLGAICAGGDAHAADIARDLTAHTIAVKSRVAAMGGTYEGLQEDHLHAMEYRGLQHAKLGVAPPPALAGHVALVTGAAGTIGFGICRELLENGCHVAVTDLAGERLDEAVAELRASCDARVMGVAVDVTDAGSVARGFEEIVRDWGGIDLVIANAGMAHVSSLTDMDLDHFRRVERVNEEGTLLVLRQSARHFERQGTGGDIVLVSTKNVFAPGAGFGAYSATKAAAHQLARIASLELAALDVRVNMVSPDAVFSEGARKSGLWAEVGPARMRARGLDEAGLEEYYRQRNLLKARVTARHVARAVLFFATRQTPTTGATIPVDGGLADSTPR